ncbi:Hsp20/alpha crystallin family protein [Mucilaginibacter sp. HD30]
MTLVKFGKEHKNGLVNPFYNDVYSLLNDSFFNEKFAATVPAVNIAENENAFEVALAVPGLKKEDIKINLDKNVLSISADKKTETTDENKKFSKREYNYNSFSRSFTLPQSADSSKIDAEYVDGVLTLSIAKKEEAKNLSREITLK